MQCSSYQQENPNSGYEKRLMWKTRLFLLGKRRDLAELRDVKEFDG
jgi:hypothetical protein